MTNEPSPLTEANSKSLEELFSGDPLGFQEQDFQTIVREFRAQAERWAKAEAAGKTRAPSAAKTPKLAAPISLTLDDLDIK